ncbi:protein-export chaperone SecB [Sphaerotilus uruguayifluvii]|uniref:Preprotein translocase subunit SecB n=1 Tax=Sphaerotilus uruguayifluvii TaxID=2735897 RepID=A0ABX2G930_9BURK|nr:protein-export chaperone SecB [Leptothrix sp. C29]NRT58604.1 preprotein translocase subunit SecB [Leptothrix sp. C29]
MNNSRHPIQLQELIINKLSVVINDHERALSYQGDVSMSIMCGKSGFSEDDGVSVGIRVKVEPGAKEVLESVEAVNGCDPAFLLEVELSGHFTVDVSKFKKDNIDAWSRINAPFLLLPYVREHVYGLASRAGIRGIIIPLFVQPGTENLVKQD